MEAFVAAAFIVAISAIIAVVAFFKRSKDHPVASPVAPHPMSGLVFKSNVAFFETECRYGQTVLEVGRPLIAIVADGRAKYGSKNAVTREQSGIQRAMITVASADGGYDVFALTATGADEPLSPGDLVAWIPMERLPVPLTEDPRSAWLGLITAKLAPRFDANGPVVLARY